MNVNFKGSFFTLSKFLPFVDKGGAITILSSINATTGQSNSSVYSASKGALNSLVKVASTELAPRGIRINAVCPGPISTNLLAAVGLEEKTLQNFASSTLDKIPLKRFGKPEEVAKLVAFLSGEDAAFITGSEFVIDGGTKRESDYWVVGLSVRPGAYSFLPKFFRLIIFRYQTRDFQGEQRGMLAKLFCVVPFFFRSVGK